MNTPVESHRMQLQHIAHQAMLDNGLLPDFSPAALAQLGQLQSPALSADASMRDMRDRLWCSIDNNDSRDLDQLTVAEALPGGQVKIFVSVADVDSLVKDGSPIDEHAHQNTTSVYTPAEIFPMLPEKLSTDLTSLNFGEERLSLVVEMVIDADGTLLNSEVYRARVTNKAKLAYNSVAAWLEGSSPMPAAIAAVAGLADNLHLQDQAAQKMKTLRQTHGALSLQTIETTPVFDGDQLVALEVEETNRAKELIEDFMIGANTVIARSLSAWKFPSIRRVVRVPKRWDRIVEIAKEHNFVLPAVPDSKALEAFLVKEKAADPLHFPDLSLTVIKLLGSGEYVAELPGGDAPGHFGLAVKDYGHSTAPNRRYPDLLTQRLVKAALGGQAVPYTMDALNLLATHCTEAEDAAKKVERQVEKSADALLLQSRIGEQFDALVTGASPKGTWVRLLTLPVEGKLDSGFEGLDVGHQVRVQLTSVDVQRGFIDFKRIN